MLTDISAPVPAPPQPPPMPTAAPIHKKMMETVLHHRNRQLQRLSRHARHFEQFVIHLVKSLNQSRYEQSVGRNVDLLAGHYVDYLLTCTKGMEGISLDKVACHFMALMYRSLDERLSSEMRLHAVGCVRRASGLLKEWLEKVESGKDFMEEEDYDEINHNAVGRLAAEDGKKTKRRSDVISDFGNNDSGQEKESSNKRSRKGPLEMSTTPDALGKKPETTQPSNASGDIVEGENIDNHQREASKETRQEPEKKLHRQVTQSGVTKETAVEAKSGHTTSLKAPPSCAPTQEKDTSGHQTTSFNKQSKPSEVGDNLPVQVENQITHEETNNNAQLPNDTNRSILAADKAIAHEKTAPPAPSTKQSISAEKESDAFPTKETISTTNNFVSENETAVPLDKAPPSSQSKERATTASKGVSDDNDQDSHSLHETSSTKTRDFFRTTRGAAVSDIEMANSATSVQAPKKSSSRLDPSVSSNMTTPDSAKDVRNPKDVPGGLSSRRATDPIRKSTRSGNVECIIAATESTNISTLSDKSRANTKSKKNEAGPASSAKPIERLTTNQSAPIAHPPAVGTMKSIRSGSVSAFAPVNSSGIDGAVSRGSAIESGPAATALDKGNDRASTANELQATTERPDRQFVPDNTHRSKKTDDSNDANKTNTVDQDVIDLTTPPGSPRASLPIDEGTSNLAAMKPPTPVIKQLPPSPPPVTKILKPPPLPFPAPRPFAETRQVAFLADNKIPYASGSLHPRPANSFSYNSGFHLDGSGACLEHRTYIDVQERLSTWDPYWRIVGDLGTLKVKASDSGMTFVGTRTTACVSNRQNLTASNSSSVNSCAVLPLNLPKAKEDSPSLFVGVKWGELATPDPSGSRIRDQYKTGDTRLILRTLPLFRTPKDAKKRADTHIWPQGTLVQLGSKNGGSLSDEFIVPITQRRQEKHDEKSWKGMSHILDLTKYANPQQPLTIKLSSCEVVENIQSSASCVGGTVLSGSYAVHAAICEYVSPDDLYDLLMGIKDGGNVLIPTLSERSAKIMAKEYVANQTVALVDSDDEGALNQSSDESHSLTFSLLCPIQRTPMETPVRGRNCKHLQCFDLRNFLRINESISGGRWRCGNCEDFLSVRDLVHCGLFQAMIDKYKGQISGIRDKVSLRSDGSFSLKDENKLRYANKKGGGASNSEQSHASAASSEVIIDLD